MYCRSDARGTAHRFFRREAWEERYFLFHCESRALYYWAPDRSALFGADSAEPYTNNIHVINIDVPAPRAAPFVLVHGGKSATFENKCDNSGKPKLCGYAKCPENRALKLNTWQASQPTVLPLCFADRKEKLAFMGLIELNAHMSAGAAPQLAPSTAHHRTELGLGPG